MVADAALLEVQPRATPDGAEKGFVDDALEVGRQLIDAGQGIVGVIAAGHLSAHVLAGLIAVIEGSQGSIPPHEKRLT